MGRRALPSPDRTLDLSGYLKTFDDLPCPWDVAELFTGGGSLEIEVGSGKGLFMQRAAEQFPDRNFLGIEIARKYARFSAARLAKRKLDNAMMGSGDALRIFRELLPNEACSAVHIYFPDPWWKKRHEKRLVLTSSLLDTLTRLLIPGGELFVQTDVAERGDQYQAVLDDHAAFEPVAGGPRSADHEFIARSPRERKAIEYELPIVRLLYRNKKS